MKIIVSLNGHTLTWETPPEHDLEIMGKGYDLAQQQAACQIAFGPSMQGLLSLLFALARGPYSPAVKVKALRRYDAALKDIAAWVLAQKES